MEFPDSSNTGSTDKQEREYAEGLYREFLDSAASKRTRVVSVRRTGRRERLTHSPHDAVTKYTVDNKILKCRKGELASHEGI